MIGIRRAEIKDIPMIMDFLDEHWLKGYALARDREFFDWHFVKNGKVNIWIGIDDEEGKMYAMEGAILYNSLPHPDFSACLWIAPKCDVPMLGLRVSETELKELDVRAGFALGLSDQAVKIQRRLHKPVFPMDHYYILNDLSEYKIAKIINKEIPEVEDSGYTLEYVSDTERMREVISPSMLTDYSPHKDYEYVEWRYFRHPIFKYDMWAIKNRDKVPVGAIFTREEYANGKVAAKIVDYYGDNTEIRNIGYALTNLVKEKGYEYIDVYSYGVDVTEYKKAGFNKCDEESENIIPNSFQPYLCKNISLYMIQPLAENSRLFRGDADQDKPRFAKNYTPENE